VLDQNSGNAFEMHDIGRAVVFALLVAVLLDSELSGCLDKSVHGAATPN